MKRSNKEVGDRVSTGREDGTRGYGTITELTEDKGWCTVTWDDRPKESQHRTATLRKEAR